MIRLKKYLLAVLALSLFLVGCGKSNKETVEETKEDLQTEQETVKEKDNNSKTTENTDLNAREKFALEYFTKLFKEGVLDVENTFRPDTVSKESLEEYAQSFVKGFDYQDMKDKAGENFTVRDNHVIKENGDAAFGFAYVDDKILFDNFYVENVILRAVDHLVYTINGVNSKDIDLPKSDKFNHLIDYTLPKTKIKIENKVLGDMEKEISLINDQEIIITELFEVPENINKQDLTAFTTEVTQKLTEIIRGKATADEVLSKYFEDGTPSSVLSTLNEALFYAKAIKRDDSDFQLVELNDVKYLSNDTLIVTLYGKLGTFQDCQSTYYVVVQEDGSLKISKYQPSEYFMENR